MRGGQLTLTQAPTQVTSSSVRRSLHAIKTASRARDRATRVWACVVASVLRLGLKAWETFADCLDPRSMNPIRALISVAKSIDYAYPCMANFKMNRILGASSRADRIYFQNTLAQLRDEDRGVSPYEALRWRTASRREAPGSAPPPLAQTLLPPSPTWTHRSTQCQGRVPQIHLGNLLDGEAPWSRAISRPLCYHRPSGGPTRCQ